MWKIKGITQLERKNNNKITKGPSCRKYKRDGKFLQV